MSVFIAIKVTGYYVIRCQREDSRLLSSSSVAEEIELSESLPQSVNVDLSSFAVCLVTSV